MPILWVDLETTGLDMKNDLILEIGAIMTDMSPELVEISRFHGIISPEEVNLMEIAHVVWMMHLKSGLWSDIRNDSITEPWDTIATTFEEWVRYHTPIGEGAERVSLGGSMVSNFDRHFLLRDFPWLKDILTYWDYDINPVRNFLKLISEERPHDYTTHRAMDDIRDSIDEARWFLRTFRAAEPKADGRE